MQKRKNIWGKLMVMVSSIFMAVMCVPINGVGIVMAAALVVFFAVWTWRQPLRIRTTDNTPRYVPVLLAGVTACLNIGLFYGKCAVSQEVQYRAAGVGLGGIRLALLCAAMGIVAFPFIYAVCVWLLEGKGQDTTADNPKKTKIFYGVCLVVVLAGVLAQLYYTCSWDIWTDEAFSLGMLQHSYGDMIRLTAADVHPPLYYLILKLVVDGIHMVLPGIPTVYLAKLVSVIPFIALVILALTKVRKTWGDFTGVLWAVAVLGMPSLIGAGVEARMYSWGLLFVTVAYLYMYDIIQNNSWKAWAVFVLNSLGAAYTHYYACIAVAVAYLGLLIWVFLQKKSAWKQWMIASIATVVGYLPWLFIFIRQAGIVSEDYWIESTGVRILGSCAYFLFQNGIFVLGIVVVVYLLLVRICRNKGRSPEDLYTATGILVPMGAMAVGLLASVLIRPVFMVRYMLPGLACLWLGALLVVRQWEHLRLKKAVALTVVLLSVFQIAGFVWEEQTYKEDSRESVAFLDSHDGVYIMEDSHVQCIIEELTGRDCYLWKQELGMPFTEVYPHVKECDSVQEAQSIAEQETLYYVETESGLTVQEFSAECGLDYRYVGTYWLNDFVNFYKMSY